MSAKSILVLMSTYNGARFAEAQIRSILEQKTQHTVHLRIRDDGSVDQTCDIIEKLQCEYPSRIELIKAENIGCNPSFFALLKDASGYDYYAISDQDDIWLENKLDVAVDSLQKEDDRLPLLFASTSYLAKDDLIPYATTRKKQREFTMYNTLIQNICPGHTQVMNNALLDKLKTDIDAAQVYVYDAWIMNVAMLYGKIVFTNDAYTLYRQHASQQLGSGTGKIGQLLASFRRVKANDANKYAKQIAYFCQCHREELQAQGYYEETEKFLRAVTFWQRVKYACRTRMYRQNAMETMAFRLAIIAGKYLR